MELAGKETAVPATTYKQTRKQKRLSTRYDIVVSLVCRIFI